MAPHSVSARGQIPEGARRGVVIVHEILGLQPEIDRVVQSFAHKGYAAVAPDFFAGGTRLGCIVRMMRACSTGKGQPARIALAAREWICKTTRILPARVGLVGFCLGGGFALAIGRGWGAVSASYGTVPPKELLEGIGPVIACFGKRDRAFRGSADKLRQALGDLGVPFEILEYPNAGHSFLTEGQHPMAALLSRPILRMGYCPEEAKDAWKRIHRFFDEWL